MLCSSNCFGTIRGGITYWGNFFTRYSHSLIKSYSHRTTFHSYGKVSIVISIYEKLIKPPGIYSTLETLTSTLFLHKLPPSSFQTFTIRSPPSIYIYSAFLISSFSFFSYHFSSEVSYLLNSPDIDENNPPSFSGESI